MTDPESSPFLIDRKQSLNLIKRPWNVEEAWKKYFPMDERGEVWFQPPWRSPAARISDRKTGLALIELMRRGRLWMLASLAAGTAGAVFLFWESPCFAFASFLTLMLVRAAFRQIVMPRWCRPLLKKSLSPERGRVEGSFWGGKKRPRAELRLWASGAFFTSSWSACSYWSEAADPQAWAFGGLALLSLLCSLYAMWFFLKRTEIPWRGMTVLGALCVFFFWGIFSFWAASPVPMREMGSWGYLRQSPPSEKLAHFQTYMSPVNLDRRLQKAEYRPLGRTAQCASYYLSPQEYGRLLESLRGSGWTAGERCGSLSDPETLAETRKTWNRRKYPDSIVLSPDLEFLAFSLPVKYRREPSAPGERIYEKGGAVKFSPGITRPSGEEFYSLYYDSQKHLMHFLSESRRMTPFQRFLRLFEQD